jgi:hypothetical protein
VQNQIPFQLLKTEITKYEKIPDPRKKASLNRKRATRQQQSNLLKKLRAQTNFELFQINLFSSETKNDPLVH